MVETKEKPKVEKEPKPPGPPPWVMPKAYLGEPILHFRQPGSSPVIGIVTEVGDRTLSAILFPPMQGGYIVDGVRHASDPQRRQDDPAGIWDRSAMGKLLHSATGG